MTHKSDGDDRVYEERILKAQYTTNSAKDLATSLIKDIEEEIKTLISLQTWKTSSTFSAIKQALFTNRQTDEKINLLNSAKNILTQLQEPGNTAVGASQELSRMKNELVSLRAAGSTTAKLLHQLEKVVATYNCLDKEKLSTNPREIDDLALLELHRELSLHKNFCYNKNEDKHRDKYVVLSLAAKVIEGKASYEDLQVAMQKHPLYNAGISSKTEKLLQKTITACQDKGWDINLGHKTV